MGMHRTRCLGCQLDYPKKGCGHYCVKCHSNGRMLENEAVIKAIIEGKPLPTITFNRI